MRWEKLRLLRKRGRLFSMPFKNWFQKRKQKKLKEIALAVKYEIQQERYSITRELLSRVSLECLKKIVEEAEKRTRKDGFVDYSLLADCVKRISKY